MYTPGGDDLAARGCYIEANKLYQNNHILAPKWARLCLLSSYTTTARFMSTPLHGPI